MQICIRATGCQDFHVELGLDATVSDVKIAATAGCDIDPALMKVIHDGKVLKDDDALRACGVDGTQPLHVARSRAPAAHVLKTTTTEGDQQPGSNSSSSAALQVTLKGPNGSEATLEIVEGEPLSQMRGRAAALFGLSGDEIHLVLRGKLLKEDEVVATIVPRPVSGDVLHVARRAVQAPSTTATVAKASGPEVTANEVGTGAPMPNAFSTGALDFRTLLANVGDDGIPLNLAAMQALEQQLAAAARQPAPEQVPMEVRLPREVRAMGHQVRLLVAERQGVDVDSIEEDQELLDHIARTIAQARARGAPVPNPVSFVDQALSRAAQARALDARLDREAHGLDPELEDALMAAEQVTQAAARAPRRLGRGDDTAAGSRGQ